MNDRPCATSVRTGTQGALVIMGLVPKVTFLPENITVEFESGKLPYEHHGKPESILDVALNEEIDLEHACGGSCACTTCHIIVKEGMENLSEADDDELDRLDMAATPVAIGLPGGREGRRDNRNSRMEQELYQRRREVEALNTARVQPGANASGLV